MQRDAEGLLAVVGHVAPRFTTRLGLAAVLALSLSALIWGSPASPVALWRGDLLAATGRAQSAVEAYDAVARANPFEVVRLRAMECAGNTLAIELGDERAALDRFHRLVVLERDPRRQAAVLERIGSLEIQLGDDVEGSRRLREAHDLDPTSPDAVRRLARAATVAAHAGDLDGAQKLWRRLARKHPGQQAVAELGLADVALRQGRTQDALTAFVRAGEHTFDPDVAAAAKFGASVCLERLGDLEEALAELDEAELPPHVFEQRVHQVRTRLPSETAAPGARPGDRSAR